MAPDRSTEVCAIDEVCVRMDELPDGAVVRCSYQAPTGVIPDVLPQVCQAVIHRDGNFVRFGNFGQICVHAMVACAERGDEVPIPRFRANQVPSPTEAEA